MRSFPSIGVCLRDDRRGVTALEYGMIAFLIAAVAATGVTQVGTKVLGLWNVVVGIHL